MTARQNKSIKKFGRQRDQRRALIKSLADSLILDESIKTTLPKAKAVARYTEKLLGKAKKGKDNLSHRRAVISGLNTVEAAHKLVDELAPRLAGRSSGYFRVEKLGFRRGDNTQLAKVSFVDELKSAKKSQKAEQPVKPSDESDEKVEPDDQTSAPQAIKDSDSKIQPTMPTQAPKRSGIRGNR